MQDRATVTTEHKKNALHMKQGDDRDPKTDWGLGSARTDLAIPSVTSSLNTLRSQNQCMVIVLANTGTTVDGTSVEC